MLCAETGAYEMNHAVCWVETGTGDRAGVVMCVGSDAECDRRGGNHARCLRVFLMWPKALYGRGGINRGEVEAEG